MFSQSHVHICIIFGEVWQQLVRTSLCWWLNKTQKTTMFQINEKTTMFLVSSYYYHYQCYSWIYFTLRLFLPVLYQFKWSCFPVTIRVINQLCLTKATIPSLTWDPKMISRVNSFGHQNCAKLTVSFSFERH